MFMVPTTCFCCDCRKDIKNVGLAAWLFCLSEHVIEVDLTHAMLMIISHEIVSKASIVPSGR